MAAQHICDSSPCRPQLGVIRLCHLRTEGGLPTVSLTLGWRERERRPSIIRRQRRRVEVGEKEEGGPGRGVDGNRREPPRKMGGRQERCLPAAAAGTMGGRERSGEARADAATRCSGGRRPQHRALGLPAPTSPGHFCPSSFATERKNRNPAALSMVCMASAFAQRQLEKRKKRKIHLYLLCCDQCNLQFGARKKRSNNTYVIGPNGSAIGPALDGLGGRLAHTKTA